MNTPTKPWTLMYTIYKETVPDVHRIMGEWRARAAQIPNDELRRQALVSMETKAFHCEGGAAYSLLAKNKRKDLLRFIIAYQTICDYLDNLCDWSDSQDPDDFEMLHESLKHALAPGTPTDNYYKYRKDQDDNGYLKELVETCQSSLVTFPGFSNVQENMEELSAYYRGLQVHKHVVKKDREPRLTTWFERNRAHLPEMTWYEFNACTGSTLGIFAMAGHAARSHLAKIQADSIKSAYFPYVQGIHILLDYFIDREEDIEDDELNFCAQYPDEEKMAERIRYFKQQAEKSVSVLPDAKFHSMIIKGLIAIYLADEKVQTNPAMKKTANQFIRFGGLPTAFFYLNTWIYRRKSKEILGSAE
ncbi:tetraprenyl-beta-curcumene synthase [Salibacterium salarium]|uniref:tetraprenyl-beta-curcumene synthase family protein n=1 Tax=Salibacterium salarium TaxID=284579 RepID=UPI00278558D7|nr:tetraprenyl-beta-curcumene synthase family protein [Salibacterium salarium]MDQ0298499.1 tetraprenyl-beta-curcumene synthase [Salibacterium salarium]